MIYLRPLAGLCNRLRVMSAAMALAHDAMARLKVYWQIDPEMNTKFSDLFEPIAGVSVVETTYNDYWQRAVFHRQNIFMNRAPAWPIRADAITRANGFRPSGVSTCSEFYGHTDYSWIIPRVEIQCTIDEEWTRMGPGPIVGVHIRRTDNAESIKASPTELFIKRMQRELEIYPETRFFVATDDDRTKDELRNVFGEGMITRNQVARRSDVNGVRDALVDLMLLSRCSRIYGSYWSSFSGVAAKIGGRQLEIMKVV